MKTRYIYYGIIAAGIVLAIVGFAVGNALRVLGIIFAVVAAIALIVHLQNEKKVAERLAEEKDMFRRNSESSAEKPDEGSSAQKARKTIRKSSNR